MNYDTVEGFPFKDGVSTAELRRMAGIDHDHEAVSYRGTPVFPFFTVAIAFREALLVLWIRLAA